MFSSLFYKVKAVVSKQVLAKSFTLQSLHEIISMMKMVTKDDGFVLSAQIQYVTFLSWGFVGIVSEVPFLCLRSRFFCPRFS